MKTDIPLPPEFLKKMQQLLGDDAYSDFLQAYELKEPSSIRKHPIKGQHLLMEGKTVSWEKSAVILDKRPVFALDPAWHAGAYYVQESASMLTGHVLKDIFRQFNAPKVLDACAAPGGKSTHLLSCLHENGLLVANELIQKRNQVLVENIQRWGYSNVIVTKESSGSFSRLTDFFDVIVADAPCSGEGLFRKQREAIEEWSLTNVAMCAKRQKDIINDLIPALKTGGYLCYSTCTFETSENEDQVQYLIDSGQFELIPIAIQTFPELSEGFIPGTIRCWPHKTVGSGFFIALLKKIAPSKVKDFQDIRSKRWQWSEAKQLPQTINPFLKNFDQLTFYQSEEQWRCFPKAFKYDLRQIAATLLITYFGIEIGDIRKGIFQPAHALTYTDLLQDNLPIYSATEEASLDFLRKKDLPLKDMPTGWALVKWQNLNLGWIKVLPDRINNYLPVNRMLRMQAD